MTSLRIGTRASALALAQAKSVAEALGGAELVPMTTAGDRGAGGDKGRFVAEIERALLDGEVDLAVHSAKDVPAEIPEGLALVAASSREDPADAWVGRGNSLEEVPQGGRVGTSSLRRRAQLLAQRPDLEVVPLRGNVDTRLRKRAEQDLDGIVLAAAGLRRLAREDAIAFLLDAGQMTPAAGQGTLVLEARQDDPTALAAAGAIDDRVAAIELSAERATVAALGATCNTPVGVRARLSGEQLEIEAFAGLPDGSRWLRDSLSEGAEDPAGLGRRLAERMLAAGADAILLEVR